MTLSTLISGKSDQDLLLLLRGHHGCPPPPGADADEESCSFIRYQLKLAARSKPVWGGGTVAVPPKIGLRGAVQRMLFCTTDEQIESFILPFQRKGRDACADQHAVSVGGTDPGPPAGAAALQTARSDNC